VILVPMWLKRHDEVEESRSVDRFTSAMHTLSRRDAADKRYVVMPQRSRSLEVHVSGASDPDRRRRRRWFGIRGGSRGSRGSRRSVPVTAATRRRRTLTGLVVTVALTLIVALVVGGAALWGLQIVADLIFVAFVAYLVVRARAAVHLSVAAQDRSRPSRPAPQPVSQRVPVAMRSPAAQEIPVAGDVPVAHHAPVADRPVRREQLFDQTAVADPAIDLTEQELEIDLVAAEAVFDQSAAIEVEPVPAALPEEIAEPNPEEPVLEIGGRPWEPVPVPRPTYTTKPPAPSRAHRAPLSEPLLPPAETASELDPADDLEEILDRRWAVND
jgi:hypothetical protein